MVLAGGVGGPMLIDTSNDEAIETNALRARNTLLDRLIAKKCAAAEGSGAP
jgi:hypothetical protein